MKSYSLSVKKAKNIIAALPNSQSIKIDDLRFWQDDSYNTQAPELKASMIVFIDGLEAMLNIMQDFIDRLTAKVEKSEQQGKGSISINLSDILFLKFYLNMHDWQHQQYQTPFDTVKNYMPTLSSDTVKELKGYINR